MAVPNTDTFTFHDVTTELYGDTAVGRNLVSCFADAVAGSFDSNYNPNADGTDNNLLNFRNYNAGNNTLTIYSTYVSSYEKNVLVSGSTASQLISVTFTIISLGGGATGVRLFQNSTTTIMGSIGVPITINQTVGLGGLWSANMQLSSLEEGYYANVKCEITNASIDGIPVNNIINVELNYPYL